VRMVQKGVEFRLLRSWTGRDLTGEFGSHGAM
jgi:hypothetical protein